MYYKLSILNKGGKYSFIWFAAIHAKSEKQLNKRAISNVSITTSCDDLQKIVATNSCRKVERFSLYLSSQLMYGIVIIYKRAVGFAYEEIHLIVLDKKRTRDKRDDDVEADVAPKPKRPRPRVSVAGVTDTTIETPRADTHQIDVAPPTSQDIANITLREDIRPAAISQGEIAPNDLLDIGLPVDQNLLEYEFRPDRTHATESSRILEVGGPNDLTIEPPGRSLIDNLPEIVVTEHVDLPANRTLVVSELDSLEAPEILPRRGRPKKQKKLIIDKKRLIKIITSSQHPEYAHVWCFEPEEARIKPREIKETTHSLLQRPVTRLVGDTLRSRFVKRCKTNDVLLSAENDILQLILGRPLSQPDQQLDAPRGLAPPPSALLESVNFPERLETSVGIAPGSEQISNIPPMPSVSVEMNQILPVPFPDNLPEELETPMTQIRPEPEILRSDQQDRGQIEAEDPAYKAQRTKWKASKIMEKLKSLWTRKVHTITMTVLCNPDVNSNLDAAFCFRTLLDLYAGRYIRVSRDPDTSEIMNIMQGEKLLRPRVLRLEDPPQ